MNFKGKSVFLSGPISSVEDYNRPLFDSIREKLFDLGAKDVYNPTNFSPWNGEEPKPHEHYMLRTLRSLTLFYWDKGRCWPGYDVILMLPGWEGSTGASLEFEVAKAIGLKAAYAEEEGLVDVGLLDERMESANDK